METFMANGLRHASGGTPETLHLDGMPEVADTPQNGLVPSTDTGEESLQEAGLLPPPPHPVQPRADNQAKSPLASSRSSKKAKKLPQKLRRKRGRRAVKKKEIFPCIICLCPFTNKSSAYLHERTHLSHDERMRGPIFHANCPHCKKLFLRRRDFERHLFTHMSGVERAVVQQGWRHACYFCNKLFQSPSHLGRHIVVHTGEKLCESCTDCGKMFASKQSLTRHRAFAHLSKEEKIALSERPGTRVCLFCGKKFLDNHRYQEHLVSHTEEKPFPCDQCGQRFARNYGLKVHKRLHSADPRPFQCPECDRAFTQEGNLLLHVKTVHGKVKDVVACPQCAKKFGRKCDMVTHLRSVHLQIRHPCPHCGHSFTQKSSLRTHLKKVHGLE
ncbi:zinc finger protein OZF-like [Folsomia candida]|uniref:zinc finger protein OZF-like n=1 Tax=Folsomia candida TaxID=158441 RepID=UPI001605229E|nr:zinc finger protein OZF-like [Folsomia candida]XP_035700876.1 zinc finger protein OZF-like [Folsomia candida]